MIIVNPLVYEKYSQEEILQLEIIKEQKEDKNETIQSDLSINT